MYLIKSPKEDTKQKILKGTGAGVVVLGAIAAVTGLAYWYMKNNRPQDLPKFLQSGNDEEEETTEKLPAISETK